MPSEKKLDYLRGLIEDPALVVFDMQNRIAGEAFNRETIIPNIKRLIRAARSAGVQIIYSQQTLLPYEFMGKYRIYERIRRGEDPKKLGPMHEGRNEWNIVKEIAPTRGDFVIKKHQPGLFTGTIFDHVLRAKRVDSIILTGCSTQRGIESTARDAAQFGYIPVVVKDAVGTVDPEIHEAALTVMSTMFEVLPTKEVLERLLQMGCSRNISLKQRKMQI